MGGHKGFTMMEPQVQDLENIEISIAEARKCIEFADRLAALEKNADFKAIILDDYLKENALRLVRVKADPSFQASEQQDFVIKQLDAIGILNQFFNTINIQAHNARMSLDNDLQERELLLAEKV